MESPKCYNCRYKRNIPGDTHIQCVKPDSGMTGDPHGIKSGWFTYPFNFDPIWMTKECSKYCGVNESELIALINKTAIVFENFIKGSNEDLTKSQTDDEKKDAERLNDISINADQSFSAILLRWKDMTEEEKKYILDFDTSRIEPTFKKSAKTFKILQEKLGNVGEV